MQLALMYYNLMQVILKLLLKTKAFSNFTEGFCFINKNRLNNYLKLFHTFNVLSCTGIYFYFISLVYK